MQLKPNMSPLACLSAILLHILFETYIFIPVSGREVPQSGIETSERLYQPAWRINTMRLEKRTTEASPYQQPNAMKQQ